MNTKRVRTLFSRSLRFFLPIGAPPVVAHAGEKKRGGSPALNVVKPPLCLVLDSCVFEDSAPSERARLSLPKSWQKRQRFDESPLLCDCA
jgi:hypothetical protein